MTQPTHQLALIVNRDEYGPMFNRTLWVQIMQPKSVESRLSHDGGELGPARIVFTNVKPNPWLPSSGPFMGIDIADVELLPVFSSPQPIPFADWLAGDEQRGAA